MARPGESRTGAAKRKYAEIEQELSALRTSRTDVESVLNAIRSRDEADATAIFNLVRQGADIDSIVRHISTGDLLLQLRVTPETRLRYKAPYGDEMPQTLRVFDNPYLTSSIFDASFVQSSTQTADQSIRNDTLGVQYVTPYLAGTIEDYRLHQVKPSLWTNVSADDALMRQLLQSYFLHEYQWFPSFHKDHFLDDMMSRSTRFCSSLLVNAVLACACVCDFTRSKPHSVDITSLC